MYSAVPLPIQPFIRHIVPVLKAIGDPSGMLSHHLRLPAVTQVPHPNRTQSPAITALPTESVPITCRTNWFKTSSRSRKQSTDD
jgi:hypothetical protein